MEKHLLVLDQGATSSRAVVINAAREIVASAQREVQRRSSAPEGFEHDPEDIWTASLTACQEALACSGLATRHIAAMELASQRETVVVWDRVTGRPIHNAIVGRGLGAATSRGIARILDNAPGAREQAGRGRLAFGPVASFLLWRLTLGQLHLIDEASASRTQLYDNGKGDWDETLLALFDVPRAILPEVRDRIADFGETSVEWFEGAIPIRRLDIA